MPSPEMSTWPLSDPFPQSSPCLTLPSKVVKQGLSSPVRVLFA